MIAGDFKATKGVETRHGAGSRRNVAGVMTSWYEVLEARFTEGWNLCTFWGDGGDAYSSVASRCCIGPPNLGLPLEPSNCLS